MSKEFCKMSLGLVLGLGTCLGGLGLASGAEAQCTVPPSCESLGYGQKAADCANRPVLKCPFDTAKVYCGVFVDEEGKAVAELGDVLYSDMTVGDFENLIPGKTPIGMVVDAKNRKAIALKPLVDRYFAPKDKRFSPNDPLNITSNPEGDFEGKDNTKKLLAYIGDDLAKYEALHACQNYTTKGTKQGDWYLPAGGELLIMSDANKLKKINPFSCINDKDWKEYDVCQDIFHERCNKKCGSNNTCYNYCIIDKSGCNIICSNIRISAYDLSFLWTSSSGKPPYLDEVMPFSMTWGRYSVEFYNRGGFSSYGVMCMINF